MPLRRRPSKRSNQARALDVEDVLLLLPWSYRGAIDKLAEAFLTVPASIHLGPEHDLVRFGVFAVSRLANVPCLRLERAPLSRSKRLVKRLLDLAVACDCADRAGALPAPRRRP